MSENNPSKPFRPLGGRLKLIRQKMKESLAEVAGAVEIDEESLLKIEEGEQRPSEDVLLLLISHFDTKEDEATKLWELAGYDRQKMSPKNSLSDTSLQPQAAVMVLPMDARIVYTDMVHVMVNNYGVIMNFMQTAGPNSQPLAVARVGMSKEHAQSVLELLQQTLNQQPQTPRALPAPKNKKDQKPKN